MSLKDHRCKECEHTQKAHWAGRCEFCPCPRFAQKLSRTRFLPRSPIKPTKTAKATKKRRKTNLKAKLWKIFSLYIRWRDADENGMAACVSCGEVKHVTQLQAGHYVPKSLGTAVYFEETNVHNQCVGCNVFRGGNTTRYALYMVKRYGPDILQKLETLSRTQRKISTNEYEELIQKYSELLKKLQSQEAA